MELALFIYLVDRASAIFSGGLVGISVIFTMIFGIASFLYLLSGGDATVKVAKEKKAEDLCLKAEEDYALSFSYFPYKKTMRGLILYFTCVALVPDKDTMYTMLAAYGVQSTAESEEAQQVAGKSLEVLEKAMDEYLAETD